MHSVTAQVLIKLNTPENLIKQTYKPTKWIGNKQQYWQSASTVLQVSLKPYKKQVDWEDITAVILFLNFYLNLNYFFNTLFCTLIIIIIQLKIIKTLHLL